MDHTLCISNKIWEGYAAGTLPEADLLYVRRHVKTCAMCSDIMEGIDSLAKPESLPDHVQLINNRVDERLGLRKKRMAVWLYSGVAAVLIAVVGLGWLVLNERDKETADMGLGKSCKEEQPIRSPGIDSPVLAVRKPVAAPKIIDRHKSKRKSRVHPEAYYMNDRPPDPAMDDYHEQAEPKALRPPVPETDQGKFAEAVVVDTVKLAARAAERKDIDTTATMALFDNMEQQAKEKSEKKVRDLDPVSMARRETFPSNYSYNNNNFPNAPMTEDLEMDLFRNQFNDSVNYAKAIRYFDSQMYDSCSYFVYPLINRPSKYYEDALLLKARTLLKQNKPAEAKAILKQAIAFRGPRSKEAAELLRTIH